MSSLTEFSKRAKTLEGVFAEITFLIPAAGSIFNFVPPSFGFASLIGPVTSALAILFCFFGFIKRLEDPGKIIKAMKTYLIIATLLIISYIVLLTITTVYVTTPNEAERIQVGWDIAKWSMTDSGIKLLENKAICQASNSRELLVNCATTDSVSYLWKSSFIILFGVVNIIVFIAASLFWGYGWGLVLKLK